MGRALDQWVRDNGYSEELAVSGLLARWHEVVGPQIAEHVAVAEFRPAAGGGTVVLRADSQAWALELRYMTDSLLRRIKEELGSGLVSKIDILGPATSRTGGRLRVRSGRRSPRR